MNEIEKALQAVRPREPSPGYLDRGLARIAASAAPANRVSPAWRYATIGLAAALSASVVLNLMSYLPERQKDAGEPILVSSVLRQEGELWVQETRYGYPAAREKNDE